MNISWQNNEGTRCVAEVNGQLIVFGERAHDEKPGRERLVIVEGAEREIILARAFESLVAQRDRFQKIVDVTRCAVSILLAVRGDKLIVGYDPESQHMGISAGGVPIDIKAIKKLLAGDGCTEPT